MSAFDDLALLEACKAYARACGGNPDAATLKIVHAERALEQAIGDVPPERGICVECCEEYDPEDQ